MKKQTKNTVAPAPKKAAAKAKKLAVAPAPVAAKTEAPVDRRLTPGAKIAEWRVVPSQRKEYEGYWLQGGHFEEASGRRLFRVAEQQLFADLEAAKAALEVRQPKAA